MEIENEENLKVPGWWIDHPNRDFAALVGLFLDEILDELGQARLALSLFEEIGNATSGTTARDQQLRRIYAKSFVYALDTTRQLINVLSQDEQLPKAALNQCELFLSHFSDSRDLRNSLQHIEDRLRGIGRNRKPIPSPILILGSFRGNYFGCTTSEGRFVEIEICETVLSRAYSIVKELIWSFDWLGPGNIKIVRPNSGA